MPIKIYWGPPGSYKSASAVWDEAMRCAKQGRVLVTNLRGFTEQRFRENVDAKEINDGFSVITLKNHVPDDMEKLRRWWHWAPFGAYFILDEVQAIYPPDWSAKELHTLDMKEERLAPNGEALATFVGLMFDMHRHGNWDMVFTTPSIKKVRPEIRAAAEVAYKHKNLAILGWSGRFVRAMHSAEDNGNASDIYSTTTRKIPKNIFKLYDSTATGSTSDSKTGINIFASPRLLLLFGVLLLCGYFAFRHPMPAALGGKPQQSGPVASEALARNSFNAGSSSRLLDAPSNIADLNAWFITGVIEAPKRSFALIETLSGMRSRVSLAQCSNAGLDGWQCDYNGKTLRERDQTSSAVVQVAAATRRSASDDAKQQRPDLGTP